jgi:hypothetical protein
MEKRIVEINGVKLEIDLSQARVVENYKVGDNVKVLVKKYSDYESYPGIIIGFDNFNNLPSILVAYLETSYNAANIKMLCFNAKTENTEICMANSKEIPFSKDRVLEMMESQIQVKATELNDLQRKKEFFLSEFGAYFKTEVA